MKILVVWSGGAVPAYRQFFTELAQSFHVRVLAPKSWTHGSANFNSQSESETMGEPGKPGSWELIQTRFWPGHSARYFVPALVKHVLTYRPSYLYVMDDLDRVNVAVHALLTRMFSPSTRVVAYALQNLPHPSYYRWTHRLALAVNKKIVHRLIAATAESESVAKSHGFSGPTLVVPLWASENVFFPIDSASREKLRQDFGLKSGEQMLVYAGSLVPAKGLRMLMDVLPRFPRFRFFTAGAGPLEGELNSALGRQYRHLGVLDADALRRMYQASDYAVLASEDQEYWKEQVGRFLIEAILCGSLALGSDSGSIPELTRFPEATFRQGDSGTLAALLGALPFPNSDAIRVGQLRNVQERYTATAAARKTAEFLGAVARAPADSLRVSPSVSEAAR